MRVVVGFALLTLAAAFLLAVAGHTVVAATACVVMAVAVAGDGVRYAAWLFMPARIPASYGAALATSELFTPAYGAALYDEYASFGLDHDGALAATVAYFTGMESDDPLWAHCRGEIVTAIWTYLATPMMPVGDLLLRAA